MLAAGLTSGRTVVDLGCGQGYGSALLARNATSVVGIDIDPGAIAAAKRDYGRTGLRFAVGDAGAVQLPDNSVDVIVCFEVLEHLSDPGLALDEMVRLLGPSGLLLLSTPDAATSTDDNPFHVHELTAAELVQEIEKRFSHHRLYAQRVSATSVITPQYEAAGSPTPLQARMHRLDWTIADLRTSPPSPATAAETMKTVDMPGFLFIICSQTELTDSIVEVPTFLVDPTEELLTDLRGQLERAQRQLTTYEGELDSRTKTLADADADVQRARHQLAAYESELELKNGQLRALLNQLATAEADSAELETAHRTAAELKQVKDRVARLLAQATQRARTLRVAQDAADAAKLELFAERSSLAGQILGSYRRLIDSWLPASSRRRSIYRGLHRLARTVTSRRPQPLTATGGRTTRVLSPFSIELTIDPQPQVSIIVPVYGNLDLTLQCLAAIAEAPTAVGYEVIVVDDASPDGSADVLAKVAGITLIKNTVNSGYLRTTNIGAARSSAEYVVLLNNDTEVTAGWLDALVRAAQDPSVGAVGASLRFANGTLQEAGGIVFSDGSAWNFGRHHPPEDSRFQNLREVDYCSAACLLVRRSAWEVLDGFDPLYEPAYYEDTDLCFRLREIALSVIYQPDAVVIHHEGGTHGTDETEVGRQLRETNSVKFIARWQSALVRQQPPGAVFRARRRGLDRTVLVIDHRLPTPDRDSGSVRMLAWLTLLQAGGRHVVFIPQNATLYPQYLQPLRELNIEVLLPNSDIQALLFDLAPETDLVVLSRPDVAADYLPRIRLAMPEAVVAYDMVDFHGLRERRRHQLGAQEHRSLLRHTPLMSEMENDMLAVADVVVAISEPEAALVRSRLRTTPVVIVPNIHAEVPIGRTFLERNGFVFVGGFDHPPNRDAVHHLVQQIWPLIRKELPHAELHLVGSQMPADIADLGGGGVTVHGWLPDLTPVLAGSRVFLAPLRYGAGLKGKVGQAMGLGIPVVTTSIGVEGMSQAPVVVADDALEFARLAVLLHSDGELWRHQADAASLYIAEQFSPAAVAPLVTEFLTVTDKALLEKSRRAIRKSGK